MGARSVITLTTGPAGSGKTYVRCARFLVDEWLPERKGIHYSNFPVFRDKAAEFVARKLNKTTDEFLDRIQIIPESVLNTWLNGQSGPWDYFRDKNLEGCHVAIDECHNFCGAKTNHKVRQQWQAWLGEIRHQGATVEFLSQSPEKVAREIHYEAGLRLSLVNSEDRRDPFLGILLGDWYELKAAFITKQYETVVWEVERRNVDGKWVEQNKRVFTLDPLYFQFYDSFSRPVQGGEKASGQQREFQKRSRSGLIWWFFKRNPWPILSRAFMTGGFVYLCSGGSSTLLSAMVHTFEAAGKSNTVKPPVAAKSTEPKQLPSVPQPEKSETKATPLPAPVVHGHPEPAKAQPRAEVVPPDTKTKEAPKEPAESKAVQEDEPKKTAQRIVLVARDRIALDDGRIVRVGHLYGHLQLLEVDVRERECVFTGGRRVRLGETLDAE